jgi:hypothetical protein
MLGNASLSADRTPILANDVTVTKKFLTVPLEKLLAAARARVPGLLLI